MVTFVNDVCARFEVLDAENVVAKLNKLQLKDNLSDYQDKFKELKALKLGKNRYSSEDYFVSSFLSGFKEEIQIESKCFNHNISLKQSP